ncbi:MAG: helix-turn-helix domain-containing protein [Spirochaetia bacterium]
MPKRDSLKSLDARRLLKIEEAAIILGIHPITVWRRIKAGALPVIHPSPGTTRISREAVERLASGKVTP